MVVNEFSTKPVDWNVNESNNEAVFRILLEENHLGEDQLDNRADDWGRVNSGSSCVLKVLSGSLCGVVSNEISPLKIPVSWYNDHVKSPCKFGGKNSSGLPPGAVVSHEGAEATDE